MSDEEYKVVGELDDQSGAGVYGHNTASSGQAVGVYGDTDAADGYGLYTPDDAHVGGAVQAGAVQSSTLNDVHWVDPAEGHNVAVRDLEIDGNKANNEFTDSQEHALYTSGASDVRLSRLWAHDAPGYGIDPHDDADQDPTERIVVEDCLSENVVTGTYSTAVDPAHPETVVANNLTV